MLRFAKSQKLGPAALKHSVILDAAVSKSAVRGRMGSNTTVPSASPQRYLGQDSDAEAIRWIEKQQTVMILGQESQTHRHYILTSYLKLFPFFHSMSLLTSFLK